MTREVDFSGPYLKTERAADHINDLKRKFILRNARYQAALASQQNSQLLSGGLPKHTPTILGDAIHNLRAALDHAYCILIEANGGTINSHTRFPFTEKGTRQDLEGSEKGKAKVAGGPSDKMIAVVFDEIQPFPGGKGEDLIRLHRLDIADKHMILLPTTEQIDVTDVFLENNIVIRGIRLQSDGQEILRGTKLRPDYNNQATFEICFGRGQPFESQPVIPILESLAGRVNETLHLLEQRAKETS